MIINKNPESVKKSQALVRIGAALGSLPVEALENLAEHLEFTAAVIKAAEEKKAG